MVDPTTIDLPSAQPKPAQPLPSVTASGSTPLNLPSIEAMQQELEASGALVPEVVPHALASIARPTSTVVTPPSGPLAPIQLATTVPTFVSATGQPLGAQTNLWKYASWFFIFLSVGVVMIVASYFWQEGMRIRITTDEPAPTTQTVLE